MCLSHSSTSRFPFVLKRMIQKSSVCSVKQKPAWFPVFPKLLLDVLVWAAHGELCYEIPQCLETSRTIIIKKKFIVNPWLLGMPDMLWAQPWILSLPVAWEWQGHVLWVALGCVQGSPHSTVSSITDVLSLFSAHCMSQIMDCAVNTVPFLDYFLLCYCPTYWDFSVA